MSEINYLILKDLAKKHKISVVNLVALSKNNDPFYMGTPSQQKAGE